MNHFLLRASALGAMVLTAFCAASSQQGNQTQRFPQFENDEVKVWKSTFRIRRWRCTVTNTDA